MPAPPCCSVLSVQLHFPLVSLHAALVQPSAVKMLPAFSHDTGTDEMERHEAASGNVTEPFVVVLSVYVPSAFAVYVPVVWSEPVAGTVAHPRLASDTSILPDNVTHEDVTFQVPTTLPPQGDTLGQEVEPPALPPPVPVLLAPPFVEVAPALLAPPLPVFAPP